MELDSGWVECGAEEQALLRGAEAAGEAFVRFSARRQNYELDLARGVQRNLRTGAERALRKR